MCIRDSPGGVPVQQARRNDIPDGRPVSRWVTPDAGHRQHRLPTACLISVAGSASGAVLAPLLSPMVTPDAIQSLSVDDEVAEGAGGKDGDVRPMRWGRSHR